MDIQETIIGAKVVIESLIKLLENENVDISSIEFTIGNTENGSKSKSLSFQNLVEITLEGLDQVKAQKVAVPEGFVSRLKSTIENHYDRINNVMHEEGYSDKSFGQLMALDFVEEVINEMIESQEPNQ